MRFYVTTPIYYVNDVASIGHAYTTIAADVIARFYRLLGNDVFYLTGLDENSQKTVQAAKKFGVKNIQKYADGMAKKWKNVWKVLNISNEGFIRTTEERHKRIVYDFFNKVYKKGDIYKGKYEGLYCEGCEAFVTESDLVEGKCPLHNEEPESISEENYFFKLSKYQDRLLKHIESDPDFIQPDVRKNEVLSFVKEGLKDISISRPTQEWGIPLPIDKKHVFWTWFDALLNYISGAESYWPTDVHLMAKDIIRFHCVIWPCMLMSAGYKLPKKIFAHGFLTVNGQKMSKSLGNVIDPLYLAEKFGVDQIRYYLLRGITFGEDGDFSTKDLVDRVNNELVANISNFCYRTLSFINKYSESKIGKTAKGEWERKLSKEIEKKVKNIHKCYLDYNFRDAVKQVLEIGDIGNRYFQEKEPWVLIKKDPKKCGEVLVFSANIVKDLAILLKPVLPDFSEKLEKQLNVKDLKWKNLSKKLENHKIGKAEIVFRKIQSVESSEIKKKGKEVNFEISPDVRKLGINLAYAVLENVNVRGRALELEKTKSGFVREFLLENLSKNKIVKAYEELYRKVGVDIKQPMKVFQEMAKKSKRIPTINTVVDAYNLISMKTKVSMGAHDIDKIRGDVRLKIADGNEKYMPLGQKKPEPIKKGEYVVADDEGVMCKLEVRQGDHTKIEKSTKNILLYAQGNRETSDKYVESSLKEACDLVTKFSGGTYEIFKPSSGEDPFSSLDLKVARVEKVEDHPEADKLYVMKISIGTEKRTIVAGLKDYYTKKELEGKNIVVVANLKSAKLRGVESKGMLLAVESKGKIGLLTSKDEPGVDVFAEGVGRRPSKVIDIKDFLKLGLEVKKGKVYYKDKVLKTDKGEISLDKDMEGKVS